MRKSWALVLVVFVIVIGTGSSTATPLILVDSFTLPSPFGGPGSYSPAVGLAASADHLYLTEAYLDRATYGDLFVIDANTGLLEQQIDLAFMGQFPPGLDGLALLEDGLYGLLSGPAPTIYVMDPTNGNLLTSYGPGAGTLWNALGGSGQRLFGDNGGGFFYDAQLDSIMYDPNIQGIIFEMDPANGNPINEFSPGLAPSFGMAFSDAPMMGLFTGSLYSGDTIFQLDPDAGVVQDVFTLSSLGAVGAGQIAGMAAFDQDLYIVDVYNHVYHLTPIPEPSTLLLVGFGLIGAAALARKRF